MHDLAHVHGYNLAHVRNFWGCCITNVDKTGFESEEIQKYFVQQQYAANDKCLA